MLDEDLTLKAVIVFIFWMTLRFHPETYQIAKYDFNSLFNTSDGFGMNTCSPFANVNTVTRVRQLLHTHQGRDKLFKVLQYILRMYMWVKGTSMGSLTFIQGADASRFSVVEKNYMTVLNSRRLFRIGRFFGEWVRLRATLIRCSELIYSPSLSPITSILIEIQMVLDFIARSAMLIKCSCDDIAYFSQKGFLHSNVAEAAINLSTNIAVPIMVSDMILNTLKLIQGFMNACHSAHKLALASKVSNNDGLSDSKPERTTISLLAAYDAIDRLRRQSSAGLLSPTTNTPSTAKPPQQATATGGSKASPNAPRPPKQPSTPTQPFPTRKPPSPSSSTSSVIDDETPPTLSLTRNVLELFWKDFELHWVLVTQVKLMLDFYIALSSRDRWQNVQGKTATFGLISGLLSVYRVWTYGR